MVDQTGATAGGEFKDRKTGLLVFGIFWIIAGGFCALAIPFMVLGMMMSHSASQKTDAAPMTPGPKTFSDLTMAGIRCRPKNACRTAHPLDNRGTEARGGRWPTGTQEIHVL